MSDTRGTVARKIPEGKSAAEGKSAVEPPRHPFGPRPLGAILPGVTRPVFRRHSPAAARLMAEWADIVGPALAAVSTPRRLAAGTLTLDCSGPVALELQHLAPQLMERINGALGAPLVKGLRLRQSLPVPAPAVPPPPARPPPAVRPLPDLPPGPVGEALAALARHIPAEG